jgi:uncharacterized membrane protein
LKTAAIRRYLLAGLIVWLPILVTVGILRFIVDILDRTLALVPAAYQPDALFGVPIPGFGVLLSFFLLFMTGLLATNFLGERLVTWSESILDKIPLVRTIYNTSKQVIQAILGSNSQAFRKVLLVEYPRKGSWSIAFQSGVASSAINQQVNEELVCVFIPTTPNPTSGFLLMLPKSEVIELSMSVDEALTFIISLGMKQPLADATQVPRTNN